MKGEFNYRFGNQFGQIENFITNAGCNKLLDALFNGISPGTSWYVGLIHTQYLDPTTLPSVGDTLTTRPWTEFPLSGGTRPSLAQAAATGNALNSGNPVVLTLSTLPSSIGSNDTHPELAWGLFITDQVSQSVTTGLIMSIAPFLTGLIVGEGLTVTGGGTFDLSYRLQF